MSGPQGEPTGDSLQLTEEEEQSELVGRKAGIRVQKANKSTGRSACATSNTCERLTTEGAEVRRGNGGARMEARREFGADMGRSAAAPLRRRQVRQDARIEEGQEHRHGCLWHKRPRSTGKSACAPKRVQGVV
jgi:hypothetical protein